MKYITFILILNLPLGILSFKSSDEVNYAHPKINKELVKYFDESYEKIEISLSDSLSERFYLQGKFYSVKSDIAKGTLWIGRVNSCRSGGCSISLDDNQPHSYEYFDFLVLFNSDDQVEKVKIFSYKATHGEEVCGRGWLKQFKGFEGQTQLRYGKEIDALAGATISAQNLTTSVKDITQVVQIINE